MTCLAHFAHVYAQNGGSQSSGCLVGSRSDQWALELRKLIKREHGFGWNIREISGKVQLARRFEDGSRSAVVLDVPWNAACATEVLGLLKEIRDRMEQQRLGLREAYDLLQGPATGQQSRLDWSVAAERFRDHKTTHTGATKPQTFDRMYAPVVRQVLAAMAHKPLPRDGRTLLGSLRDRHGGEPGSRGRRLRIEYAAQLLRFAVKEQGAPERWLPPEDLLPFIGRPQAGVDRDPATPIKDAQLVRLLEGIPDPRWRLAVGLLGCFGLRPVELHYLQPKGDRLTVSYRKRTARGLTKPGDVAGLDPLRMEGESVRLLRLLESRLVELPPLGSSDSDAATSLRQYLERRSAWQSLKAETAAAGGKLTPYSLRHGYALRAHEHYDLSPRVTASLMRHSLQTHNLHYGSWTDAETIESALKRGKKRALGSAR